MLTAFPASGGTAPQRTWRRGGAPPPPSAGAARARTHSAGCEPHIVYYYCDQIRKILLLPETNVFIRFCRAKP